ncbi:MULTISPECIES: glutathione S-transferase [unclassified Shewanella]|uniref:glutathione S-transferase n=1 Tax=unclassified Shewanella TaxID=196818 RepID=UPI001BBF9FF6|nr:MULTISPECIES: glutathione S-transferase [unclassified Shewanella]GIU10329.1 glutathione S-transferase [Shewanella sp. MBTL60-112-B1]GIU32436.1 glutathione S-transferase [Shewanella sp. MBTL60-112-B2]
MCPPATLPVLYTLRNCPYAMRARMAIYVSGQSVQLRELVLTDKPSQLLLASPKGTVPVLVLPSGEVLEQSLDIMLWAFEHDDSANYLMSFDLTLRDDMFDLIALFDTDFKQSLDLYRSAKRYHDQDLPSARQACERYIYILEQRLTTNPYLFTTSPSLADLAIMPFIRQFARVERQWYLASPYPNVRQWLNSYLQSPMFSKVMAKYPLWSQLREQVIFSNRT